MVLKKIKLTDRDKSILNKNSNICTDAHGRSCTQHTYNENDKR